MAVQIANGCMNLGDYEEYYARFNGGNYVFNIPAEQAIVIVLESQEELDYLRDNLGERPYWEPLKTDFSVQVKNTKDAQEGVLYTPKQTLSFSEAVNKGII